MSKAKQYSTRAFQLLLSNNGYEPVRNKGDHRIYKNGNSTISIPVKGELNRMMTRRLIKENRLMI